MIFKGLFVYSVIIIKEPAKDIIWDSKTGMVSGIVDGKRRAIDYVGQSLGSLPTGHSPPLSERAIFFLLDSSLSHHSVFALPIRGLTASSQSLSAPRFYSLVLNVPWPFGFRLV